MLNSLVKKLLSVAQLHLDDIKSLSDCVVALKSFLLVLDHCIQLLSQLNLCLDFIGYLLVVLLDLSLSQLHFMVRILQFSR